ncbi:dTMP kinase [Actinokineospora sp. UTMC 2448]|uniref:dTMP kinase n=1 Tax=Actinokineospora sp. UTMC 2448 TaxID=2268449 RepID=UPI0021648391|nr:dTMP kinase [Actinokineospora sp. UTMC 2448]UVS80611.1 Thymidylate kinase [Actinokineospora sp. UTMC 2448]
MNGLGLLITLDGPGGAGKTTTSRHLARLLADRGHHVHAIAQPSTDELGRIARAHSDRYSGYALACLVAADRYHQQLTEIRPHRAAGHTVVCDRYVASSLVLQHIDGVPLDFLTALNAAVDPPDLSVILTTTPDTAAARVAQRGTHHRFHNGPASAAREMDLYLLARHRLNHATLLVDTTQQDPERVAEIIASRVAEPRTPVEPGPATA